MLQDHLGFMWMGTQFGLVRYDGNRMTSFPYIPGNPYGCSGKEIGALFEDQHGDIWIGAESLVRFERATQRFIQYPDKNSAEFGNEGIRFIHQDKQGFIWTIRYINHAILSRFDPKTSSWAYFSKDPNNPLYLTVQSNTPGFAEDKDGKIWAIRVVYNEDTLKFLDRKTDKFIPYHPKLGSTMAEDFKKISCVSVGSQGMLYFSGNAPIGFFILNTQTGEIKQFRHNTKDPGSLQSDTTSRLYVDKSGLLWIPTSKGLDRYDPRTNIFTHYVSKQGDLSTPGAGTVYSFYETPTGDIWFEVFGSTGVSMNFYQRITNSFTRYEGDAKQEDAMWGLIYSTLVDRTGMVWMGSGGMGLNKESRTSQFLLLKNIPGNDSSLQDDNVIPIYEAPSEPGIIWFGTGKGLDR